MKIYRFIIIIIMAVILFVSCKNVQLQDNLTDTKPKTQKEIQVDEIVKGWIEENSDITEIVKKYKDITKKDSTKYDKPPYLKSVQKVSKNDPILSSIPKTVKIGQPRFAEDENELFYLEDAYKVELSDNIYYACNYYDKNKISISLRETEKDFDYDYGICDIYNMTDAGYKRVLRVPEGDDCGIFYKMSIIRLGKKSDDLLTIDSTHSGDGRAIRYYILKSDREVKKMLEIGGKVQYIDLDNDDINEIVDSEYIYHADYDPTLFAKLHKKLQEKGYDASSVESYHLTKTTIFKWNADKFQNAGEFIDYSKMGTDTIK